MVNHSWLCYQRALKAPRAWFEVRSQGGLWLSQLGREESGHKWWPTALNGPHREQSTSEQSTQHESLITLAHLFALQEEEEELPAEEIITMESIPYLPRESRVRRSSYAFSHREGYADLIIQGTSLHRSTGVSSHVLCEEELALSIKESP